MCWIKFVDILPSSILDYRYSDRKGRLIYLLTSWRLWCRITRDFEIPPTACVFSSVCTAHSSISRQISEPCRATLRQYLWAVIRRLTTWDMWVMPFIRTPPELTERRSFPVLSSSWWILSEPSQISVTRHTISVNWIHCYKVFHDCTRLNFRVWFMPYTVCMYLYIYSFKLKQTKNIILWHNVVYMFVMLVIITHFDMTLSSVPGDCDFSVSLWSSVVSPCRLLWPLQHRKQD